MADYGPVFEGFIFRSGEWAHGFGEQAKVMDVKRHFTGFGTEHNSVYLNEITDIKHLVEKIHAFFAKLIRAQEQLDLARAVFNMRK